MKKASRETWIRSLWKKSTKGLRKIAIFRARKKRSRMDFLATVRLVGLGFASRVARGVSRVLDKSRDLAWTIDVVQSSPYLKPKFEGLEERQLLATNIGLVRQDTGAPNQLLGIYLDTETLNGSRNGSPEISFNFGVSGGISGNGGGDDQVFAGDWANLGFELVGAARNNAGIASKQFFLDTDRDADAEYAFRFGLPGDFAIAGNFDGASSDDVGVVRASGGGLQWYLSYASADPTNAFPRNDTTASVSASFSFGLSTDTPIAGDFNGDGRTDIGVVRNEISGFKRWYIAYAASGATPFPNNVGTTLTTNATYDYGLNADKPVVGDWDNNGTANLGVIRNDSTSALWLLDTSYGDVQELGMNYGNFSDQFVTGKWPDRTWDRVASLTSSDLFGTESTFKSFCVSNRLNT